MNKPFQPYERTHFGNYRQGNYANFEADGTLRFHGNATCFDDQQVNIFAISRGSSAPTETAYKGGRVLSFDPGQRNKIYFNAQLSHKYKSASAIDVHVHGTPSDNTAGVVVWLLTVSLADIGADFPAATSSQSSQTISLNSADEHLYFEITELADTSSGVSANLICSLERYGTHGDDTYSGNFYMTALDFHIECDTIGSRTELAK